MMRRRGAKQLDRVYEGEELRSSTEFTRERGRPLFFSASILIHHLFDFFLGV